MKFSTVAIVLSVIALEGCQSVIPQHKEKVSSNSNSAYDKQMSTKNTKYSPSLKKYVGLDYDTKYIFRGQTAGGEVLQPEAKVKYKGFSGSLRGVINLQDLETFNDKVEVAGSYNLKLNKKTKLGLGVKMVNEPVKGGMFEFGANSASKYEITSKLAFDTVLSPSVKAFYNPDKEAFTAEGRVKQSIHLADKTNLNFDAMVGYTDDGKYEYEYGQVSGQLEFELTKKAAVYVGANYALSSKDSFFSTSKLNNSTPMAQFTDNTSWVSTGIKTYF